jgi:hypothetical protein
LKHNYKKTGKIDIQIDVHRHAQPLQMQDVHALEEFGPDMEWTDGADDKSGLNNNFCL